MTALVVACVALTVSAWVLWDSRRNYYRNTDRPAWFAPCTVEDHALACAPRGGRCGKCGGSR